MRSIFKKLLMVMAVIGSTSVINGAKTGRGIRIMWKDGSKKDILFADRPEITHNLDAEMIILKVNGEVVNIPMADIRGVFHTNDNITNSLSSDLLKGTEVKDDGVKKVIFKGVPVVIKERKIFDMNGREL